MAILPLFYGQPPIWRWLGSVGLPRRAPRCTPFGFYRWGLAVAGLADRNESCGSVSSLPFSVYMATWFWLLLLPFSVQIKNDYTTERWKSTRSLRSLFLASMQKVGYKFTGVWNAREMADPSMNICGMIHFSHSIWNPGLARQPAEAVTVKMCFTQNLLASPLLLDIVDLTCSICLRRSNVCRCLC